MNTLILMRGVPGSGKSYTASCICFPNGIVYSMDDYWGATPEIYRKNFDAACAEGSINHKLATCHKLNLQRTIDTMVLNWPLIIVDNTNVRLEHMKPYEDAADKYGYKVIYREPDSSIWQQWRKSNIHTNVAAQFFYERNVHGVPLETIKRMLDQFQDV